MIDTIEKQYFENNFVAYKMTLTNGEVWSVPLDKANTDYQAIQEWAKIEGNNIIDPGA
jgi:hypothetical protein|tara:strand:+ start:375 stop:548 length:174 start_codon:yes stop_codon:yes gene_type:complete